MFRPPSTRQRAFYKSFPLRQQKLPFSISDFEGPAHLFTGIYEYL